MGGGRRYTAGFREATVTEVRRNEPLDPPVAAGVRVVAAGETWPTPQPWVQLSAETETRRTRVDRETGTRTAVTDERAVEDSTSSPCLLFLHKPPVVETPLPVAGWRVRQNAVLVAALVEPREVCILLGVVGQIVTVATSEEILSLVVVVGRRACVACVTAVETFVPAPPGTTV